MGNISSKQNIQLNLSKNLLPKMYINDFNNLIIKDIENNISQGIENINGLIITPSQVVTYINQLDLLSQISSSILSIIAQNISPSIINTIITNAISNAITNKTVNLEYFNNSVKIIDSNINDNILVVNNNNLINLVENIVFENIEVKFIKTCFLSHTSNFVDTNMITTPPTPNTKDAITPTNFQNSISNCTDLNSQIKIVVNNLLNNLNIKITAKNTIKTRDEYIQEFQNDYNNLQNKYNIINGEINSVESIYDLDTENVNKIHILVKELENIHSEMQYYVNKINLLQEQPFLSPTELQILTAPPPPPKKGDLDISGNKIFKASIINTQEKNQNVNKIQNTNQNTNQNNNLSNNQNIKTSSNIDLTSNKNISKHDYESKTSGFFNLHIPSSVKKILFIISCIIFLVSLIYGTVIAVRMHRAAQFASNAKDYAQDYAEKYSNNT